MKSFSKLTTLPLGSVRARGHLREQLIRSKNGMGGHLPEIEPGMIADPYLRKTIVKQWDGGEISGWGAEISGNYYAGLIQLAFTLDDEDLKKQAENWVNAVLKTQRPDGYLGTYREPDAKIYEDYNAWGNACGMRALLFYYEATGRQDVFDAAYRSMLWFCSAWAGNRKTCYAGALITEPMLYCYRLTEDKRLLDFAIEYADYLCEHTIFSNSYRDFLSPKLKYNANHTAAYAVAVRLPALLYAATGEEKYLQASVMGIQKLLDKGVHLSGAPVSQSEYVAPVSATAEAEFCGFTFINTTYIHMAAITGEAKYGDLSETVVYNAANGAKRKDERAIAYLSAPNQITATEESSPCMGDMQLYSPCYPTSCCAVNSVAIVPELIRGMAATNGEGDLFLTAYGPAEISHAGWHINEETRYPFRDIIKLQVKNPGRSLYCKLPNWCHNYTVQVNGKEQALLPNENGFLVLSDFSEAEILLTFHAQVRVLHVDDTDAAKKYPLAFMRGALLFSLPIETKWEPFYPKTETPLAPEWPWYRLTPIYPRVDHFDSHERLGYERDLFPWSVAVDEDLRPEDLTVELSESSAYPWEDPPIRLRLPAYRAPLASAPYARRAFLPYGDRLEVTEPLTLTLVPYGATNLRITYFSRAELSHPDAE